MKILIVGQGLAGTLLDFAITQYGHQATVIDGGTTSASHITSGLMNPLTGRNFIKSWRFEECVSEALRIYGQLERLLADTFVFPIPIIRALLHSKSKLEWDYRSSLKEYEPYIGGEPDFGPLDDYLQTTEEFVTIKGGYQVNVPRLISAYRSHLVKEGRLIQTQFLENECEVRTDHLLWRNEHFDHLVLCTGAFAKSSRWFSDLPYNLSKGEALISKVPFTLDRMIKQKHFLVPWGKEEMWIGSANYWNFNDASPSDEGCQQLLSQLKTWYTGPVQLIQHLAAIKPTVKDRRPIVGTHPKLPVVHTINGLGTKGVSQGPYVVRQFVNYLCHKKSIEPEISIQRCYS